MDHYFSSNQNLWNAWTPVNAASEMYEMEAFKAGKSSLHEPDLAEMGSVEGKTLLHLQCHFGQDTLSWARLGAQVTGMDFSPEAIRLARSLAQELKLPARFIECNLYDLPRHLSGEQFDIVYTSYGVLYWLPDLVRWAQIAAGYVKPGGFLYVADFHPFAMVFSDQASEPVVEVDYFDKNVQTWPVQGSYANPAADLPPMTEYGWAHPLGEVVSSLIAAGLRLDYLHEWDFSGYQMLPFLVRGEDGFWRMPPGKPRIPLMYSLKAVKA